MTVHSLTAALEDTATLVELARHAGVSPAQARAFCAALADIPVRQAIRICRTAYRDRVRQANRETRKGER